jgi:hypothetical protein
MASVVRFKASGAMSPSDSTGPVSGGEAVPSSGIEAPDALIDLGPMGDSKRTDDSE